MRIGILSTRLSGTDGVSLEVEKWARLLEARGHELHYCAGELGGYAAGGYAIDLLHFLHPRIDSVTRQAFAASDELAIPTPEIEAIANELLDGLRAWRRESGIELLIVQNALAIPMNLPLGVALARWIEESALPTIAHHHDFYWERARYQQGALLPLVDRSFPPDLPSIRHVVINSIALRRLRARRRLEATLVPNVHDFATPPPAPREGVREALELSPDQLFVLQPTRVIQRKGIEMAIELVHGLGRAAQLIVSHSASDEGEHYWRWLEREALAMGVPMRSVADRVVEARLGEEDPRLLLWEVYPHADLVTYPSIQEGFGNALLEAIYYRCPVVINRYPVYNADIRPLGFRFVELDGYVDEEAPERVTSLLDDDELRESNAEHNYALAREHFSLEVLDRKIEELLASLGAG